MRSMPKQSWQNELKARDFGCPTPRNPPKCAAAHQPQPVQQTSAGVILLAPPVLEVVVAKKRDFIATIRMTKNKSPVTALPLQPFEHRLVRSP